MQQKGITVGTVGINEKIYNKFHWITFYFTCIKIIEVLCGNKCCSNPYTLKFRELILLHISY